MPLSPNLYLFIVDVMYYGLLKCSFNFGPVSWSCPTDIIILHFRMILLIVLLGLLFLIPFVSRKLLKKEHNGKPLSEMSGPLSVPLLGTAYVFLNGGPSGKLCGYQ